MTTTTSSTAPPATSPISAQLRQLLVLPPGFSLSTTPDTTNGPIDASAFDQIFAQNGTAAAVGFVGGWDQFYDRDGSDDYVEVTILQFMTSYQAAEVMLGVESGAPGVRSTFTAIPTGVAYDEMQAESDGTYAHTVIATKGPRLLVVAYTASSPLVPELKSIATNQYHAI